jgi:hypothetical protein
MRGSDAIERQNFQFFPRRLIVSDQFAHFNSSCRQESPGDARPVPSNAALAGAPPAAPPPEPPPAPRAPGQRLPPPRALSNGARETNIPTGASNARNADNGPSQPANGAGAAASAPHRAGTAAGPRATAKSIPISGSGRRFQAAYAVRDLAGSSIHLGPQNTGAGCCSVERDTSGVACHATGVV